jgi:hypothetical protein
MFSPSLISMILHSILPEGEVPKPFALGESTDFKESWHLAQHVSDLSTQYKPQVWPRLPIVGRLTGLAPKFQPEFFERWFANYVRTDRVEGVTFFWGRVPVNLLAEHFREFHGWDAKDYYLDLGTTVRAAGSNSSFDKNCEMYLKRSAPPGRAKVGAAVVDLSSDVKKAPDNYGNSLRHVITTHELSDHAEQVLSVLLERLDKHGILGDTTVSCALVVPPVAMVSTGKSCFDQANAVEMLDALKALEPQLTSDNLPVAINMSVGTHVGPHNGDSPLEEYIAKKLFRPRERFVVAAAGNDGSSGLAAKVELVATQTDFLSLQTGSRCKDLLVEFWWDDSTGANLKIEADIYEPLPPSGRAHQGVVRIGPGLAGTGLSNYYPAGLQSMTSQSLFQAKCRNNLSCIAFALSTTNKALPVLDISFALLSAADVVVNAWIVVCEETPQTTFIAGGPEGNVRVPASESTVLSVAGTEASGQMWAESSRGPTAQYGSGPVGQVPLMAHLVTLAGGAGTSYSSPRACGDAVAALADYTKRTQCNDATDLLCQAYGLGRKSLPTWNKRSGYHKQTT